MTDVKVEMSRSDFRHILTCGTVAQAMEWFDQVQAVLAAKDQQVQAWQMAYEGLQRQLAAKDQELERLKDEKGVLYKERNQLRLMLDRIAAIPEVDDGYHAQFEENVADGVEALVALYHELKQTYDTLMAETVWAIEYLQGRAVSYTAQKRATTFLARPDVQALEKGTPPCE